MCRNVWRERIGLMRNFYFSSDRLFVSLGRLKSKHAALTESIAEKDKLATELAAEKEQLRNAISNLDSVTAEKKKAEEELSQLKAKLSEEENRSAALKVIPIFLFSFFLFLLFFGAD